MRFTGVYARALRLLGRDLRVAIVLCVANLGLSTLQFVEPVLFGHAVELLSAPGMRWGRLRTLLALWACLSIVGIAINFASSFAAERIAHRNRLRAMSRFHDHVLTLPMPFHNANHSGQLMKTMLAGTDSLLFSWLSFLRDQLGTALSIVVLLPLTLLLNWRLSLCLIALMVVFTIITAIVIRRTREGQRRAEGYNLQMAGVAQDAIANVSVVQAFVSARIERRLFTRLASKVLAHQFPVLKDWAVLNVLTRAASTLTVLCILVCGAWLHVHGQARVADIVSFMGFANLLIVRLESAVHFASALFQRLPVLEEFFGIMALTSSVPDAVGGKPIAGRALGVTFERVSFSYPGGGSVLHDVSFTAPAGRSVALVGPTGAGKSTVMALLQRQWDPAQGRILINGRDLREIPLADLRRQIGVVFQDSMLFNRSIRDNLVIGRPDATTAELLRVCRLAHAEEFIERLPNGLDTMLGERGMTLSGGQKQRLAIARALLKDPPILIFDEATSALDTVTEARIAEAMATLMQGRTTFIVAHRLSTVRNADQVLVFDHGQIVEQGAFADLVRQRGHFAELVQAQLSPTHEPLAEPSIS